jgi:hypothetical protein
MSENCHRTQRIIFSRNFARNAWEHLHGMQWVPLVGSQKGLHCSGVCKDDIVVTI